MIFQAEQILFWACGATIAYVYIGYPLIVLIVSRLFPKEVIQRSVEPRVTVLITAYNEEAAIREKILNTLEIKYPADKLEILIASDGSTDKTDDIVRSFESKGVRLFRQEGRVGKTLTQNNAVEASTGEIILFSDATTTYRSDIFDSILPYFADATVGCVAGRLVYVDDESTSVGRGVQSYWNYETLIKSAESRACSLIGASGCLYAVRRSAYEPMYPEACSDFLICTTLYRKGLRSIFAPDAVCFEKTNNRSDDELQMRVRVIVQTFTDLWRNRDMLNPLRSGFFGIELISHKLLRYAVPFLLLGLFGSSLALAGSSLFYAGILSIQVLFYSLAFGGWLIELSGRRLTLVAVPFYFVLANLASLVAFYKFLRGETYARWVPIREAR